MEGSKEEEMPVCSSKGARTSAYAYRGRYGTSISNQYLSTSSEGLRKFENVSRAYLFIESASRFSLPSTRIAIGRMPPLGCCSRIDAAPAAAPVMLCLFKVKQRTTVSGIWTVQIPEVSLTPVLLSMST